MLARQDDVTFAMLNSQYGDAGRTFTMHENAEAYRKANPGSYMYPLFNYASNDVICVANRGVPRQGAKKRCNGWLVQTRVFSIRD